MVLTRPCHRESFRAFRSLSWRGGAAKVPMCMLVGMRSEWTEYSPPWLEAIKDRLHDDAPVANDKGVGAVVNSVGRGICRPLYVGVIASDIFDYIFESAVR